MGLTHLRAIHTQDTIIAPTILIPNKKWSTNNSDLPQLMYVVRSLYNQQSPPCNGLSCPGEFYHSIVDIQHFPDSLSTLSILRTPCSLTTLPQLPINLMNAMVAS